MEVTTLAFRQESRAALLKPPLQEALGKIKTGWVAGRARAADRLPEFERLRDLGRDIKNHVLANLDLYLEAFEAKVRERGGEVHWARDAAEARAIVLDICKAAGAKTATKSKSMITEEIGLNAYLETHGVTPVETDLGEYILQISGQRPSHLVGPVVHLTQPEIADIFERQHGGPRLEEASEMVAEARRILRERYLAADVGITGANFLIAETGSAITVTNEGNAELTQGLPKTHIVVTSIEKVVPTVADAFTFLRLLARSATGQEFSAYTTVMTGPRRPGDLDGPERFHVVLLDNGRTKMVGNEFREMLRCIRCGACMNHCPVYLAAGGHAYGWVYVGPMGSVLTPQFVGIEKGWPLPNASTFCGRCEEVCPVRIPLPKLMRHWREEQFRRGLTPPTARYGLAAWGFLAKRPALYRFATGLAMRGLGLMGKASGRFKALPLAGGWTGTRDMPAPQGQTFMSRWQVERGRRQRQGKAA
jgi:L-lactate dehydrogenase complex protein LldF